MKYLKLEPVYTFTQKTIFSLFLTFIFTFSFSVSTSIVVDGKPTNSVSQEYIDVVTSLMDHINNTVVLSDADFQAYSEIIQEHIGALATDEEVLTLSFELLELFDTEHGALFTSSNTSNGFNRAYTSDGLNLHRNIIAIHQGILDHAYTEARLMNDPSLLDGKMFQTAHYFPGHVDAPEDPNTSQNTAVKCSYLLAEGSQPWATIGNPNTVRPTGCYLSPGSVAEVTVPESLVGKGAKIRVGAHYWNLETKSRLKRMDRVSILYDINDITTKIANPLGGGIYIEIPLGIDEGILDISLKNVVRSPFFSMKTFHETSLTDWMETERKHPAPWTDFETDKFMMQVPTSWIYEFEDPKSLLEEWDKSMDAVSDLLGRPRITDRHKNYLQFDVIIRGSAYHPGYPMSNTPYNPNDPTDGQPNHNILRGPQYGQDIHFHELGHEVAISKFVGEVEAIVNFLYVPVLNKCFGYTLGEAFAMSFGPSYNFHTTKDHVTTTRLVADTFHEGIERNTCSCTKNEVRYQHRGYAHYVDIVEMYGWEALERFWAAEGEAADMGAPYPVNNQEQDDRIFRMSKAAGVDLRPLFHFWGIHPNDQEALKLLMEENDLHLPLDIKSKLHQYKTLIPSNYDDFVAFGNDQYANFMEYDGTQFDFGAGWFQKTAETYDEAKADLIQQALSDIIIYYYGTDCFDVDSFSIPEFDIEPQYCKSAENISLPLTSTNGVTGSWSTDEIDVSETGQFTYSFIPNLDQCALPNDMSIEIVEAQVTIEGDPLLCHGTTTAFTTNENYESYFWSLDGQILSEQDSVNITQGGTLHLNAIDSNGCMAEVEIIIEETDPIDITIELTQPLCYGENGTALFSATNGEEYSYSIDGESISVGFYTLLVTDTFGCTKSYEFEIIQPDPISIQLIEDEYVISGGTSPYETTIDTMSNVSTVTVIDTNGCQHSTEFIITSLNETALTSLKIFPNPASEKLSFDLEGFDSQLSSVQLVAVNGQVIQNYSTKDRTLDVSEIENGVYFLVILSEDGRRLINSVTISR